MTNYKRIEIDNVYYYGKHLVLTANRCNELLLDKTTLVDFLKKLVVKIDMVAFGEPIIERFGQDIEIGISAVQLIETSAITLHTNDLARDLYLDVFSCKGFDENIVLNYLETLFSPSRINYQILLR